jgi:hypothetical protein
VAAGAGCSTASGGGRGRAGAAARRLLVGERLRGETTRSEPQMRPSEQQTDDTYL